MRCCGFSACCSPSWFWPDVAAAAGETVTEDGLGFDEAFRVFTDVLVPATAAAILGGVSLGGGTGRPLGIAAGVLTLCLLRSGLNALGVPPNVHDIATGSILLIVAILDGPQLARRLAALRLRTT